jgi:hypothetical protein
MLWRLDFPNRLLLFRDVVLQGFLRLEAPHLYATSDVDLRQDQQAQGSDNEVPSTRLQQQTTSSLHRLFVSAS